MLGIPRRRGPTKAYVGELVPFPANGAGVGLPPLLVGRGWESLKRSGHCSLCCRARGRPTAPVWSTPRKEGPGCGCGVTGTPSRWVEPSLGGEEPPELAIPQRRGPIMACVGRCKFYCRRKRMQKLPSAQKAAAHGRPRLDDSPGLLGLFWASSGSPLRLFWASSGPPLGFLWASLGPAGQPRQPASQQANQASQPALAR